MKISYLGPKGTFSEEAAKQAAHKIDGEMQREPLVPLEAIARSVASGSTDYGVMAYYNFLEGLVQECLDLIYENRLSVIGLERVPISFSAGIWPGSTDREKVYSHPKALAQCSNWLIENSVSEQVLTASTADAAEQVAEHKAGIAIATAGALKEYGLEVIGANIGNRRQGKQNFTDFYVVAEENNVPMEPGKEYLTMVAITPHVDKVGLLAGILNQISYYDLNLAKIHSRPALDDVSANSEPQMFYLETECHKNSPAFQLCVNALAYKLTPKDAEDNPLDAEVVRVLGSYEKPSNNKT